jgi:hypothetical protein
MRRPSGDRGTPIFLETLDGAGLKPFMHDEELVIPVKFGLRRCRERTPIESEDDLRDPFNAKGDEPVTQVRQRNTLGRVGELAPLQDGTGVNVRIDVMDRDADRNIFEQRPLWTTHASNLGEQTKVHIKDAEAWDIQQLLSQDVSPGEDN